MDCNSQLTLNVVVAYLLQFGIYDYIAKSVGHCFPNDRLLHKGRVDEQSKWRTQVYCHGGVAVSVAFYTQCIYDSTSYVFWPLAGLRQSVFPMFLENAISQQVLFLMPYMTLHHQAKYFFTGLVIQPYFCFLCEVPILDTALFLVLSSPDGYKSTQYSLCKCNIQLIK